MLEHTDLTLAVDNETCAKRMKQLDLRLGELQRECFKEGVPVIVVFEGWDAAGKGTLINRLMLALDARGYKVHSINSPTEEERLRPFLWRFWQKTPARGRMAIFDRSWYGRVLVERVNRLVKEVVWQNAYHEINSFERQLCDDGAVIIKLFLHISKKEQKRRFRELEARRATAWKVTREDWRNHKRYKEFVPAIEEMLSGTAAQHAPWTVIEATDGNHATIRVFETVINALSQRLAARPAQIVTEVRTGKKGTRQHRVLDTIRLDKDLPVPEYEKKLQKCQKRLHTLEHRIYTRRIPVIIAYEGWDAAGKGGTIRRLVQGLDPRGFEVVPVAAPNDIERAHHYLWRFWINFPKAGHIAIFDRSWYGRVLVERVEGFCPVDRWQRAYEEINQTEQQLTDSGCVLIKFWLQISPEEQLRRFKEREKLAHKKWKITEDDWRNREKWPAYNAAVEDMLHKTSTTWAPWTIVEAESKRYARIKTLSTVIEAIEKKLD